MFTKRTSLFLLLGIIALSASQYVDLKRSLRVNQVTNVFAGNESLVGKRLVNLVIWGDFNRTTDQKTVSGFVQEKVAYAQSQPDELLLDKDMGFDQLPLQVNLTVTEIVHVGPRPRKDMALWLSVQIYCKRRHHEDIVDALSTMEPSVENLEWA